MARPRSRKTTGAPTLRRTVADLRALAHPLRLRMMELFAEAPRTTKQVAELLGQPPTRLYHHVAALDRAGLLVVKETRQRRGAVEKLYVGVTQQLQTGQRKRRGRGARRALAATVLEQAKQELIAMPAGAKEPALLTRLVIVVAPSQIPVIRQRLFDAVHAMRAELLDEGSVADHPTDDCERWAVTLAFAPVASPRTTNSR